MSLRASIAVLVTTVLSAPLIAGKNSKCGLTPRTAVAPGPGQQQQPQAVSGVGIGLGEDLAETQNRIINGRKTKSHYPWMVKIVVKEGACGGALVTDRHILTAAHCFCEGVVDCTKRKLGMKKTLTDFAQVTIKGGARKVSEAKTLKPKMAVIHKDYQSEEQPKTYDFAVVTLAEPFESSEKMAPICLPEQDDEDMGVKVVTAGWGFTRVQGSCRTNGRGPQTFKKCQGECDMDQEVPNAEGCSEMLKKLSADDMSKFDMIKVGNSSCYYPTAAEGWCYTDKGRSKKDWGYCMRSCGSKSDTTPDDLEEASLETYPETSCYPGQTNKEQELCVGGRPLKPKTGVFKISDGKASLESQSGGGSYDFYGYMDSCQGDSGGPIWQQDGQVSTIIGVISRGAECGEKDQPGIAARVTTNLDWIREQIGMGEGNKKGDGLKMDGKAKGSNVAKGIAKLQQQRADSAGKSAKSVAARLSGLNAGPLIIMNRKGNKTAKAVEDSDDEEEEEEEEEDS